MVSGNIIGGSCIETLGADLYPDPPFDIVIPLIVPFAATVAVAIPSVGRLEETILILFLVPAISSNLENIG